MLGVELEELQTFRSTCIAIGDTELLPGISAATALLEAAIKQRGEQSASTAAACGETMLPLPTPMLDGSDGECADNPSATAASGEPDVASAVEGCAAAQEQQPGSPPSCLGHTGPSISFYQVSDGRLVFFEPFFTKLLLHEYGGRWDRLPESLPDLRLDRLHEVTVNEEVRKRHRFLSHLPLGSPISFAEADLRPVLSKETKEHFAEEFRKRHEQRKKEQFREKKQERISKDRAAEDEERYYNSLNLTHPTFAQAPPTKEDFAAVLPGRESEEALVPEEVDEGDGEDKGPTLADKIKEGLAAKSKSKARAKRREAPPLSEGYFPDLGSSKGTKAAPRAGVPAAASASASWNTAAPPTGSAAGSSSSSAWGKNCGSGRVPKASSTGASAEAVALVVPDSWDDDEAEVAQADQHNFGAALEAVLNKSATEGAEAGSGAATVDEPPDGGGGAAAGAAKKKKGRAAKATTIRLFG